MNKRHKAPDYIKILNIIYIMVSLVALGIYLFTSAPSLDEYIGFYGVASWGTLLAALLAIMLAVSVVIRANR